MSLTTYRQTGDVIDYLTTADQKAGDIIVQNDLIGQVVSDALDGTLVGLRIAGVINIPKLTTDVVEVGHVIYWDAGNSHGTLIASTHNIIGKAIEAAGDAVLDVDILLSPQMVT